jgi:hypothetical protein
MALFAEIEIADFSTCDGRLFKRYYSLTFGSGYAGMADRLSPAYPLPLFLTFGTLSAKSLAHFGAK